MADKVINLQQGQSVAPATPPAAWSFLIRKKPPQHAGNTRSAPPTHTKPKLLSNIITRPPDVFTINFGDIYKSAEREKRKQSAQCRRKNLEHAQSQAQVYHGEPQSRPNTSASQYMNAYKRDISTPISAWGSETYISRQSSPVRAAGSSVPVLTDRAVNYQCRQVMVHKLCQMCSREIGTVCFCHSTGIKRLNETLPNTMATFVLFRNSKRITLRDEDMNRSKIGLIFQVVPDSIFLSDDRNTAVFSDGSGKFDALQLTSGSHYEVNGDSRTAPSPSPTPALVQAQPACTTNVLPPTGMATQQGSPRYLFAQRQVLPSNSQTVPTFRRPMNKSFGRSVQLVEAVGSSLHTLQTIFLRLGEHEANVVAVTQKVAEQLDIEEEIIMVDSKGQEIHDGAGTQELADLSEEDAESDIDMAHNGSLIAVRVSPVSNTCCEIMGPQICQECRKNRVRQLHRERSDMFFPNVQCADEKLTTTAIVQKYLPGLSYLEIEDKLARGEIARPSVRRQLTRTEFNNGTDNKSKTKKVTIMDKRNDNNNKQKALFQKRPNELYFTNIRELNYKIISGSVDRNIGFTANNKRSSSASAPASRKSTTATSLYPVFISPRKVTMGPDTKYKKYYSPPLIALASQQVEPSFFAGCPKGYKLPEKLPKELVFLDKDGNATTRRLSSALSTPSDLTTTDENSEPLADLQENVAEESLEDTIVEETTDNESVEPESGHDDNETGELCLEMANDSMSKVNVDKDSESELVNHSMDNGEVLEKASDINLMDNGNRGNSITDEKS